MAANLLLLSLASVVLLSGLLWTRYRALRREAYIRSQEWPKGLLERLRKRHPQLTPRECQLVGQGLRQFFLAYLKGGRKFVAMPSQVVDDLWHELILYTRHYQRFCQRGFGHFLHHTPAVVLGRNRQGNAGLRRCWWWACQEEHINPKAPSRLPLLFALDAKLGIGGGFHYVPDCGSVRRTGRDDGGGGGCGGGSPHCGADFSSDSFDGGTDGFGDGGADGDGGGGDGGGDGGGGCGGGD